MSSSLGLFHKIIDHLSKLIQPKCSLFGMRAIQCSYSVAQATRFGLYCSTVGPFLHQESEASTQGGGESSRRSSSNEAASRRHTLSCEICRLHGTNPPSAEREDASCAQTLPQRHRSDMHCFCGSSSWLARRSL